MKDSDYAYDEGSSSVTEFKPSYVLIAIDTHESMFLKDDDGDTPFSMALKACYSLADSLLLVQNRRSYCQYAIAFADEDAKASFIDFKGNVIDSSKLIREKSNLSQEELKDAYMRKGPFDLASFFLFCKKKFMSINSAFYHRTIVYITNDPDPVCGDSQKKFTAINEAKTFKANKIKFQMVTTKHSFEYKIFYNELLSVISDVIEEQIAEDEEGLFDKLSSIIVSNVTQRRLNFYPNKNDATRYIPIVKRGLVKKQTLNSNARVSREGKLLKRLVKGGNNPSNKFNLKGHQDVVLSLEDKVDIKKSDLPIGLTLLYVSKRQTEVGFVIQKTGLIEFNESAKEHLDVCRNVYTDFWNYCYEKERVLICARKLTYNDHIRFVELIPKFSSNRKMFVMKVIPHLTELRHAPPQECSTVTTDALKQVTKDLVDKLTFDYDPTTFCNPSLARKQAYIKSKLLNEPMEEVFIASIDMKEMDERIKDVASRFKSAFNLNSNDTDSKKRKGAAAGGSRAKKTK